MQHSTRAKSTTMFQCKVCPYNTLRKPFLDKHMQQKHGFSKVNSEDLNKGVAQSDIETNIKRKKIKPKQESPRGTEDEVEFGCEMCDFKTKHEVLLNMHVDTHESGEGEMYQCTQCSFTSVDIGDLRTHANTHKTFELFKCPHCDYASRHKCNFKAHLKIHEDPESLDMIECKFCDRFKSHSRSSLYTHIRLKHGDSQKVHQCDKCLYVTPYKGHLTNHQMVHMDRAELPTYHCEICEFETYSQTTIKRHVNKHKQRGDKREENIIKEVDDVTKTVWFCCDLCQFKSKDQRYVILHKKVHKRADELNRKGMEIVYGVKVPEEKIDNDS